MKTKLTDILYNLPIHLKNYIILESNPDLSDNTYALYKLLLENKINQKYKIFWFVDNKKIYKNIKIKNVYFVNSFGETNFFQKLKKFYINIKAKYIIDCNKLVYKKNINQKRIYLGHGMPYKKVAEYCNLIGETDYLLSLSDFFIDNLSSLCLTDRNKIVSLGFPRNDSLFFKTKDIKSIFKDRNYNKIIVWLPTYRQRKNKNINLNMKNFYNLGIPIIYNIEMLKSLNNILKDFNILLVLKPHPAQDLSILKTEELSNFIVLTDQLLEKENISLYEFLGQTDGLITDYSSVYYDYLLIDKPIAITTDDLEEYKKIFDFVYDNIFDVIKGEYINNFDDLKIFFNNIANEKDVAKEERKLIKEKIHKYPDGNSSKRVYDFLVNNMGL